MRRTCLTLSAEDKDYLKALSKKRTIQAQVVDRARILLYKAGDLSYEEIADKLQVSTSTVRLCISKYNELGIDAVLLDTKHGSWLNMIESCFSKMTKQMLRGICVKSKQELTDRIYKYFEEVNREPVVYHWKYKMDEINENEVASF